MKALCWYGYHADVVETVPDPEIINPHDAIRGEIDGSFITHRMNLDEAAQGYSTFRTDQNGCIEVVLQP